jgi:hypothetical protein
LFAGKPSTEVIPGHEDDARFRVDFSGGGGGGGRAGGSGQ